MKKVRYLQIILLAFFTFTLGVSKAQVYHDHANHEHCNDDIDKQKIAEEKLKEAVFQVMQPYYNEVLAKAIKQAHENPEAFLNGPATCFSPETEQRIVDDFYARRQAIANSLGIEDYNSRFTLTNRWSATATDGGGLGQGDITTLTWSYTPDGTSIGNNGCQLPDAGTFSSNFIAFFNGIFGPPTTAGDFTTAPWHPIFVNMFNSWSSVTGLTFVYEPNDDGVQAAVSGNAGALGLRGDIRICGHLVDGNSGVLACNYFPNNGDMIIDTGDNFYSNNPGAGTTNVLTHEVGHGLGLRHVCPVNQTKLMEPFVTTAFVGPQEDDILANNRHYGDADEGNDSPGGATNLGASALPTGYSKTQRSIDDDSDVDHYAFTVALPAELTATLTPTGTTYLSGPQNNDGSCSAGSNFNALTVSNLQFEVLDTDGATVLATGSGNAAGAAEMVMNVALPGAGTYYIRVSQEAFTNNVQMYDLALDLIQGDCELNIDCALLGDITVPCLADVPTANNSLVVVIEACGTTNITSADVITTPGDGCPNNARVITRTYTITDEANNTETCVQTITVSSTNGPTITCPATKIETCIAEYNLAANQAMVSASAECGIATVSYVSGPTLDGAPNEPADCNGATYTVTFEAEDDCGRTARCTQQVAIVNNPPTIVCDANVTIECEDEIIPAMGDATVTTACATLGSTVTWSAPVRSGQPNCDFTTYMVTYTGTDDCGRQASCVRTFTIDNADPVLMVPPNVNVACEDSTEPGPAGGVVTASYTGGDQSWEDGVQDVVVASLTATVGGIPDNATVTDVNITIGGDHSFVGDLEITLISPDLTAVLLVDSECGGDDNVNVTLDDEGPAFNCGDVGFVSGVAEDCPGNFGATAEMSGTMQPSENPLSNFNGETAAGDWTVEIYDNFGGDGGCFSLFEVEVSYAVPGDGTGFATATASCDLGVDVTYEDEGEVNICEGYTITRTWTATDDCGRTDVGEQLIEVDPALDPVITFCPPSALVNCPQDIVTTPEDVEVDYDCGVSGQVFVSGPIINGEEGCPGTTYTYTYTVIDDCGNSNVDPCIQVFTIIAGGENVGPTIDVVEELTVDCFEAINPNPDWADITTGCGDLIDATVTVTDPILISNFGPNCPNTRYRVTYTVIDACGRDDFAYQYYTIQNDGPTMACPDNCEVFSCYDGDYNAIIEAWLNTVTATSSCADDLTVYNNYDGVNGTCIFNGTTPVTFWSWDECGRYVECNSLIIIADDDAPDVYVQPEDQLIPCTANTDEIYAAWLADNGGAQAVDACGGPVWWQAFPNQSLDCEGGPQSIEVDFVVTDNCGNSTTVSATFNTKLLPLAVNVAGLIQTEAAEAVSSVQVAAYQSAGMTEMDISDDTGDYSFEELPYEDNTEIVPSRNDDYLNGLTTYDLILLQMHILGVNELNSPYKRIAADANRSGSISTLDLVLLRRLILHIDEELEDNTSWRFVDADYVFPNPQNPFIEDFPEVYSLTGLEEELADFIAVKIGDLNLDAQTNSFSPSEDRSSLDVLKVQTEDQLLRAGQEYEVALSAANFEAINGFQFTLNFDRSAIEILDIQSADLIDFDAANYGMSKVNEGAVTMSWNTNTAQSLTKEDVMFSVVLRAQANVNLSDVLAISSAYTKAEAYSSTELMNVDLSFLDSGLEMAHKHFKLFQNQPNPFMDMTTIGFILPEAGEVTLEIYDATGKIVYMERNDFAKGYQQIDLSRDQLTTGVLYYKVSTAEKSASKRMLLLE